MTLLLTGKTQLEILKESFRDSAIKDLLILRKERLELMSYIDNLRDLKRESVTKRKVSKFEIDLLIFDAQEELNSIECGIEIQTKYL